MTTRIALTSPHTTDKTTLGLVSETQRLLKSNPFEQFRGAAPTGVYDQDTSTEVQHAKYALGYATAHVNGTAGDGLRRLLSGSAKLPVLYRARRQARLIAAARRAKTRMRNAAVTEALTHLGYHEGANNDNRFGAWYGVNHAPWCAMFVTYCYLATGSKRSSAFVRGRRFSYVPAILEDARGGKNGLTLTANPIRGDLVLYYWKGLNDPSETHVELFISGSANSFKTVGGNVGDSVRTQLRSRGEAAAVYFVRVTK